MIKEENIPFLNHLIETLESSFEKFEKTYERKDAERFNEAKKTLLEIQRKILEITKW